MKSTTDLWRLWQPFLLGAGFVLLVMVGGAAWMLSTKARGNATLVAHTLKVERQVSDVLLELRRAESAERAYLITADSAYLTQYQLAAESVRPELATLKALIPDNPREVANVAEMTPLIERRLADLAEAVRLRDQNKAEAAADIVRQTEGRSSMDAIRDLAGRMIAEEERLFGQRADVANTTYSRLFELTLIGGVLIVLLGGTAIFLVRRSDQERERAQQFLIDTNENLESMVEERSRDLIAANEEIQRFAYIVSHDLRSPLVNIMGFTTELETLRDQIFGEMALLRQGRSESGGGRGEEGEGANSQGENGQSQEEQTEEELSTDFDEAINFIKSSIGKMDRLIGAVLKLSREGRRDFHPEDVEMTEMVETLVATVAHQAMEAEAELTVERLPNIYSDRLALEQIFSNLIDNALKYLRPGAPGRVEIVGRDTPFQVVYEVKDNGRGIAPGDHERVFELFRRAGQQDRPGEGIGLAHVRALVRRLGGDLKLESSLGEGSLFIITLPKHWSVKRERTTA